MTTKIVEEKKAIWLAQMHIMSILLAFFAILASVLLQLVDYYSAAGALSYAAMMSQISYVFGIELAIIGFICISVRAMYVRELSVVSGHLDKPKFIKGDNAVLVGIAVFCVAVAIQIIVNNNLLEWLA